MGWDINPRALGVVPKEAKVFFLKGYHWILDAHYLCIPKGVSNDKLAVLIDFLNYMLSPPAQAMTYDDGYFYPGPAVKDVPLSMAPAASQKVDRGIRAARICPGDHRRSAGVAAAAGQARLCVQPLGRGDRLEKEEVTAGKAQEDWRSSSPVFRLRRRSAGRSNRQWQSLHAISASCGSTA